MTEEQARADLCAHAKALLDGGLVDDRGVCVSLLSGDFMFITPGNVHVRKLRPADIAIVRVDGQVIESGIPAGEYPLHAAVYAAKKSARVIIHVRSGYTFTSSCAGKTVYPMLDDMAQIVGATARIARCNSPADPSCGRELVRALRRRNAAFLEGDGAFCFGGSFDDAHAVAQVLEKGCRTFIETEFIGGGVRINPLEANLMRLVYVLKYSKSDTTNR